MKILKKRAIALIIDSFWFAPYMVLVLELLKFLNVPLGSWVVLLFLPLFARDIVFRNASIGKKIMGIRIYDNDWKAPGFFVLLKRSFFVITVGYVLLWKAKFVDGEVINFFDFEREKLGTRVVDKKVYANLKEEAEQLEGDFKKNMTELYNAYLRNTYMK